MNEEFMSEIFDQVNARLASEAVTLTTLETQQAQIKGLVAALKIISLTVSEPCLGPCDCPTSDHLPSDSEIARKALSALPAEFLERERKRDAVIRAACDLIFFIGNTELNSWEQPLKQAVDAL